MRGHVRKRRTWEFIVDVGPHPVTGGRRQKSKSGFASKKEAESALHEFIRYVEGGGEPCPQRVRLAAYLDQWLEYQRARSIRPLTLETYAGYIRREIVPAIGGLEVAKLRQGHVRAVLTRMQRGAVGYDDRSSARRAQFRFTASGRRWPHHAQSRRGSQTSKDAPSRTALADADATGRAAGVSRGTLWEVPILLATVTGARRSEILGISWEDVDLKTGTIAIRRGVQRLPGRENRAESYSRHSRPGAPVGWCSCPSSFALERVRRHRRDQLECRGARGTAWRDPPDELGEP